MTKKIKCPRCQEWTTWENNSFRPFCSENCKARDLGAWASEEYRIPVRDIDPDTGESESHQGGKNGDDEDQDEGD